VTGLVTVSPFFGEMMYSLASAGRGVRTIGAAGAAGAACSCSSAARAAASGMIETAAPSTRARRTRRVMDVSPVEGDVEPTRSQRRDQPTPIAIAAALLALFAVLVALRLHGFSLPAWHAVIDGSAPAEVLLGAPRPIRSDDWKMQLPLLLAQGAADPAFPVVNPAVGLGQDMRIPVAAPVASWITLFRPTLWGYFLGADVGLAWQWWSQALGLFGVWLAGIAVVTRGRLGIAAIASALLVASPFFQFWSLNAAPHATAAGAVFLAVVALARAATPLRIGVAACGLALAGAWFALTIYPPYQVTLGWLVAALAAGFLLDARRELPLTTHAKWRVAALALAGVVALAVVAVFAADAREAIEAMRNTVYPGRRISTGGDRSIAALLNASLGAPFWASDWGAFFNECEAASFWLLSPVALALWVWRWARGEKVDAVAAALGVYVAAFALYATLGVPEWLARATALGFAPGKRVVIGLGIADVLLLARFAATARSAERGATVVIALAWLGVLAACAGPLARDLPDARLGVLLAFAAGNAVLAAAFLRRPRWALPALLLVSAASSLWFNPLVRGGADYLRDNPLSQRILELDRAAGGGTVWASFGRDDIGNLFRAIGVRALGGVQPIPQNALWRRIDPAGSQRRVYDRYAHVAFVASPARTPRFKLHSQDYVIVQIDPRSPAFRALGATHVLVRDDDAPGFEKLTGWTPLAVVGPNHLYQVPR